MGSDHGNYSRNMYEEDKMYVQRRVQQGIPWIDADDNDIEQANYNMNRRLEQLLGDGAFMDGFKCVGTGANNDFDIMGGGGDAESAGRFFLKGNACILYDDVTWKNTGGTEGGKSIQSRITAIEYQSGPGSTLITDSAANWGVNEHVGKVITPDITQPGSTYIVASNTQTQFTVTGDATTVAQVGDNYRIELLTPSGGDRTDGVFLNVYLDEYDCDDDPNLKHNLSTQVCAQLRIKLIQTVYVKEGSETFPDYVDTDGKIHWTFQIARLHRFNGQDAINPGDFVDLRPILSDGNGSLADIYARTNNLKPVPSDPMAGTIDVLPGVWTKSDRSSIAELAVKTTSGAFSAVTGSGLVRYDLVSIDDSGSLQIKVGSEVAAPGDPFTNGPAPDGDKLALAFVKVDETASVVITREDITDVREFLNIGVAANALMTYSSALWYRPHEQAVATNTVRIEPGRSVKSDRSDFILKESAFDSPVFPPVTTPGNVRYDLLQIDDAGTPQIKAGAEIAGPGSPADAAPPDADRLSIAIVKVDETVSVIVNEADITDMREFLNLGGGGGGDATSLVGVPLWGTPGAGEDGYVWKYIHSNLRFELRPDATGGGTIVVKDSITTVSSVSTVNFPSGAVVTDAGGGQADVTISGGGGGGVNELEIQNFRPDDIAPATNVELWTLDSAVRFRHYQDEFSWFSFEKPSNWDEAKDILIRIAYSLTTTPSSGEQVKPTLDYWVINHGTLPVAGTPDATLSETYSVVGDAGDTFYYRDMTTLKIANADIPAGDCRVLCKLGRDTAVANNYAGSLDIVSLVVEPAP